MAHNIDDIDDETFVSKKPQNYIFSEKADQIREKTAGSIKNSLRMIYESQHTGSSTLETLAEQREKLEETETNLDQINAITRASQKHLNSMKSFLGGMFSRKSKDPPLPSIMPRSATVANVQDAYKNSKDTNMPSTSSRPPFLENRTSTTTAKTRQNRKPGNAEEEIIDGLDEMANGVSFLKEMALKLGDEIDDQGGIIDRIAEKSERANDSIKHQNRQINQLLKK